MAIFLCVSLTSFKDTSHIGLKAHFTPVWHHLNWLHLRWPFFQIRSLSEVQEVRASTYPFRGTQVSPEQGWTGLLWNSRRRVSPEEKGETKTVLSSQISVKVWGCKAMNEAQKLGEEWEEGKRGGEGDDQVGKNTCLAALKSVISKTLWPQNKMETLFKPPSNITAISTQYGPTKWEEYGKGRQFNWLEREYFKAVSCHLG